MRTFWQNDHTIRLSLLGVCVSLLYLTVLAPVSSLFPPFGFLQVPRDASQDLLVRWRNDLQPPPPQAKEILLVTIDDESQRQLNKKWPWDRMFFADFLQRIAQRHPKVVFFDIVFSGEGSAASDAALADAIQQATQDGILVLLGASYDFLKGDFQVFPHPLFEEAGGGGRQHFQSEGPKRLGRASNVYLGSPS